MNELAVLMHLLSRKNENWKMGANRKEILDALSIPPKNRNASIYFQDIINGLSRYIEPLGLQVRYNPIDENWFLSHDSEISDLISANPFDGKPRLAATLLCTLMCCLKYSGKGKLHEIKEMRKKKSVIEDLGELEKLGYISINKEKEVVEITSLIGYQLDLEKLFINLALKLKSKEREK